MEREINDMQCWIFRHAQTKWGLSGKECSRIFREHRVLEFIADCYDILHLSSCECALEDVGLFLKNRGVELC